MAEQTRFLLPQDRLPKAWYNIVADLPFEVPPLLHPVTREPTRLPPPLFCDALIEQEETRERYVEIPEPVREVYRLWRPTPLVRARRLERALDTPAHIYYKYEGASPPGSHKPNTAVAQAFYSKEAGVKRLVTETGAGQWGSALAFACNLFGMECGVYMVKVSYYQKPYRRVLMEAWGARVVPSPSPETQSGRSILERDPDSPGSLGIAISEAVEVAATHDDTKYSLGSVLNHVLLHRRSSARRRGSRWRWRGSPPTWSSAAWEAGAIFPDWPSPSCATVSRTARPPASWPWSPRPAPA
jgi:tryptophan synthase beta chain